jgi:hypothetical protein
MRARQDAGLASLPIALKVSAVSFPDENFAEGVQTVLRPEGLITYFDSPWNAEWWVGWRNSHALSIVFS